MKASEILTQARDLIVKDGKVNPDTWYQGEYAVDSKGEQVLSNDPNACRFCSVGAVGHVTASAYVENSPAYYYLNKAAYESGIVWAIELNDKHPELVPAMFYRAIELAKANNE